MSFPGTILLLAGLVSAILVPIFVGHGLAVGDAGAVLIGVGAGVLAAILIFLFSRFARRGADGQVTQA